MYTFGFVWTIPWYLWLSQNKSFGDVVIFKMYLFSVLYQYYSILFYAILEKLKPKKEQYFFKKLRCKYIDIWKISDIFDFQDLNIFIISF